MRAPRLVPVSGRLRFNRFAMAHAAALAGFGVAIFREFACAEDLREKRLVSVLDAHTVAAGEVWIAHPTARYLAERVREVLVAEDQGAILGQVLWVAAHDADAVEIKSLAVRADRHGAGIGRALIDAAVERSREHGVRRLLVATASADLGNLRFYQRCGQPPTGARLERCSPDFGTPRCRSASRCGV